MLIFELALSWGTEISYKHMKRKFFFLAPYQDPIIFF